MLHQGCGPRIFGQSARSRIDLDQDMMPQFGIASATARRGSPHAGS
jgi:hypothetical protein